MRFQIKKLILLCLSLFLGLVVFPANIVYPWRATTAIVKSGDSFEVWLNADENQKVKEVVLQADYHNLSVQFKSEMGLWVYDVTSQNTYNTRVTVKVPRSAPADRYDIVLNTTTGNIISRAGVKVTKQYKSDYYILHISDIHAFQNKYPTTLQRVSAIVDMANIINPEMVFNTGDNLYRPTEERMNALFAGNSESGLKGFNQFNAATFTVAGNHDIDFDNMPEEGFYKEKAIWWNKWWGLQSFFFSYGKGRFMGVNNGWHGFDPAPQFSVIKDRVKQVGAGNFRLAAAHIRNHKMPELDSVANLNLILLGHNHHIANQNPTSLNNKPVQYIVNSMRDNMELNLYKVDGKTGKYTAVGGPTAQVSYIENPDDSKSPELYKPKLTIAFSNTNNGSGISNTATVINKFPFAIEGAHIRFIMPQGKKYTVSKGKIEQQFDGTNFHVVDVNVDLEANNSTLVEIK
jgi:hypothetical protein